MAVVDDNILTCKNSLANGITVQHLKRYKARAHSHHPTLTIIDKSESEHNMDVNQAVRETVTVESRKIGRSQTQYVSSRHSFPQFVLFLS
jgi:hypothetical protein